MKKNVSTLLIVLIVLLVLLVGCQSDTVNETEILEYSVEEKQDVSYLNTPRMVYRIILDVDKLPSDKEMEKTAIAIWEKGNKNWKEFTVFMYLPEMDIHSLAYGIGEFRQNGLTKFKKAEYALIGTKWEVKDK